MSAPAHTAVVAANLRTMKKLGVVVVAMFGFGFALVPFYEKLCEWTGIRNVLGKDDLRANTQVNLARVVTIEFDANLRNLPWTFQPVQRSVQLHPGALTTVLYEVRNTKDRPVKGQAVPSFGPQQAAQYFKKLDCFCFTQQTLAAGEVRQMPVTFVVDPALPEDINTITLSYTFFEVEGARGVKGG
jgi:cytochrome c oxidase assembly protein subunit 11